MDNNQGKINNTVKLLESKVSELKIEIQELNTELSDEKETREFYQTIADFTNGWELWFEPDGKIKYCSSSCYDLCGYTSNQILSSPGIDELLVYETDREKFNQFISGSLNQSLLIHSIEFRILSRHKQLIWCVINVRGVYNRQGRYQGIRTSIHDISKLKRALGQIHELSTVKDLENKSKLRIKSKLEFKERELLSILLQLSRKNELFAQIGFQLKELSTNSSGIVKQKLDEILQTLAKSKSVPVDWEMINIQADKLYPGFMDKLSAKHPLLTQTDKKLCVSIRLGLSSKEIASLMNHSSKSVEIARVRLRKKLKLQRSVNLPFYLESIL